MRRIRSQEERRIMLEQVIPHRLAAVKAMGYAVQMRTERREGDAGISIVKLGMEIRGNANAVLNAWIEAGIIHGRALLEFLGVAYDRKNETLKVRDRRARDNDWRISDFGLELVTPGQARSAYQGASGEADRSLVSIMVFADRSIAHMTNMLDPDKFGSHHLRIAADGIQALTERFLYLPLGLPPPKSLISRSERS